jgi:predicted  nucleic acid-binding Zn-ribbon protein
VLLASSGALDCVQCAKSKELEQFLSAKTAARAATDDKVLALEKEVAVVQSELEDSSKDLEKKVAAVQIELEDARKAAEGTRALLGGESALLSKALERARAQGITLAQERDALASEVESLT